jgi:aspartate-semialdehyde dehydrogenase
MDGCRIAVVGATGAVGTVFLRILEERSFPATSIRLCASERSWGKKLTVGGRELVVEEATPELFGEVDIVFISASSELSRRFVPLAVEQGALVIDDSSAFRMDPDVPLVVPEVNGEDLEGHRGIVAIPNCSTTPLVMVLKPLGNLRPVRRVVVDTYQSVSGTGASAMEELRDQSGRVLAGDKAESSVYPHQIAFNVLPHIEPFLDNGYTREEMKMVHETRKILHLPQLAVSATCARVPVMVGHSEAIHIEFTRPVSASKVREMLSAAPGVRVLDDPASNVYPMPIEAEGKDEVFVGRIRNDVSNPNGVAMWVVSDNLRKGAALNAIQIAEEVVQKNLLGAGSGGREVDAKLAARGVDGRKMEEREFERAKDYYRENFERLVAEYEGQFVAVIDDRVVDSDVDFSELAERVYGRFGYRDIYMPRVSREHEILQIRSPRIVSASGPEGD